MTPPVTSVGARRALPQQGAAPSPPPFSLLVAHFGLLVSSLLLGSLGLVRVAPLLATGNFLAPRVLAVVHLFTLGVILTAIAGVLQQFYPMALGWGLRSVRVAFLGVGLLMLGVTSVASGFWFWHPVLLGTGWILLVGAVGCVSWNLLPARRRSPQARFVGGLVSAGHVALGFAMLFAAIRIGDLLGWWTADRLGTIAAHYHLAGLGFGTLTALGIGSRMLPMFLVAEGAPARPVPWIAAFAAIGLACFSIGAPLRVRWLVWLGASFMFAAVLTHVAVAQRYFRRRLRRQLDPAMQFVRMAFINLLAAALAGAVLLLAPRFHSSLWIVYGLLGLLGWLVTLIMGILQKLVPHLTRMRLFVRTGQPIPAADTLMDPMLGRISLIGMESGLIALVSGVVMVSASVTTLGALLWLAGILLVVAQFVRIPLMARGWCPLPSEDGSEK